MSESNPEGPTPASQVERLDRPRSYRSSQFCSTRESPHSCDSFDSWSAFFMLVEHKEFDHESNEWEWIAIIHGIERVAPRFMFVVNPMSIDEKPIISWVCHLSFALDKASRRLSSLRQRPSEQLRAAICGRNPKHPSNESQD